MPIPQGAGLFIPVDDPSMIYILSTDEGQDVAWIAA
jgi:hypothetical protein